MKSVITRQEAEEAQRLHDDLRVAKPAAAAALAAGRIDESGEWEGRVRTIQRRLREIYGD